LLKAVNMSRGTEIGNQIMLADAFWSRFRGLLGRKSLMPGEGILLHPCSSIHCLGMRFPIDAVFLDRDYRVLAVRDQMKPGALASCKGAACVLELAAGEAETHSIQKGDQLQFCQATD